MPSALVSLTSIPEIAAEFPEISNSASDRSTCSEAIDVACELIDPSLFVTRVFNPDIAVAFANESFSTSDTLDCKEVSAVQPLNNGFFVNQKSDFPDIIQREFLN